MAPPSAEDEEGGLPIPGVISADGTAIAFETMGEGPAVILVDGALCHRSFGPMRDLATLLASHFTVYTYDRRGRGESGDTQPYVVTREVEDIAALIDESGGETFLYGISSGGALALEAARALGAKVRKLALYEAPYNDDADALAKVIPNAEWRILADQRHDVASDVLAPVLVEFFQA